MLEVYVINCLNWLIYTAYYVLAVMLSPRGQHPQGQIFGLGLVVSGLSFVLGLVQCWPCSHLGWPRGKSSKSGHE